MILAALLILLSPPVPAGSHSLAWTTRAPSCVVVKLAGPLAGPTCSHLGGVVPLGELWLLGPIAPGAIVGVVES